MEQQQDTKAQVHLAAPCSPKDFRADRALSTSAPSAHTPGPWVIQDDEVYSQPAYQSICIVLCSDRGPANARLIAVAPELAALLIESQHNIGGDWRARRDATLTKAGVQP